MKQKKFLAMLLVLAMVLTLLPVSVFAADYGDTAGHWGESSIERWSDYGVLQGNDGNFDPDGKMTRGQFAQMLCNMMGYTETATEGFGDVAGTEWYAEPLLKLKAAGVMQGSNGNANPKAPISREEVAVLMCRALKIDTSKYSDKAPDFADGAAAADWAKPALAALKDKGMIGGVGDNKYAPKNDINRASVAAMADKMVAKFVTGSETITGEVNGVILIAPSAAGAEVKVENATVTAPIVVAPGAEKAAVSVEGTSKVDDVVAAAPSSSVTVAETAAAATVTAAAPDTSVAVAGVAEAVTATPEATGETKVEVAKTATVAEVKNDAPAAAVTVAGTVGTATMGENAKGTMTTTETAKVAEVVNASAEAKLDLGGTITSVKNEETAQGNENMTISGTVTTVENKAADTTINTTKDAKIENVIVAETATGSSVAGDGQVTSATVQAEDVKLDTKVESVTVADTVADKVTVTDTAAKVESKPAEDVATQVTETQTSTETAVDTGKTEASSTVTEQGSSNTNANAGSGEGGGGSTTGSTTGGTTGSTTGSTTGGTSTPSSGSSGGYAISLVNEDGNLSGVSPISAQSGDTNTEVTINAKTGYKVNTITSVYMGSAKLTSEDDYTWTAATSKLTIKKAFNAGVTITASATAKTFTVAYDSNGGSPVASESATYGTEFSLAAGPTKANNRFAGWTSVKGDTSKVLTNGAAWAIDGTDASTITLYALWVPTITVTFDMNGENNAMNKPESVSGDADVGVPEPTVEPSVSGKVFKGWYTDAACTTGKEAVFPIMETSTVYAKWAEPAAGNVVVSFDLNGGSGTGDYTAKEVAEGGTVARPAVDPTKEGDYVFGGWLDAEEDAFHNFATGVNASTVVKANWVEITSLESVKVRQDEVYGSNANAGYRDAYNTFGVTYSTSEDVVTSFSVSEATFKSAAADNANADALALIKHGNNLYIGFEITKPTITAPSEQTITQLTFGTGSRYAGQTITGVNAAKNSEYGDMVESGGAKYVDYIALGTSAGKVADPGVFPYVLYWKDANGNVVAAQKFSIERKVKPAITSVAISGTPKIGETLTATVKCGNTELTDGTNITVTWSDGTKNVEKDGSDAWNELTVPEGNAGKKLKVTVAVADNHASYSGTLTSAETTAVAKKDGPSAPSVGAAAPTAAGENEKGKITGLDNGTDYQYVKDYNDFTGKYTINEITGKTEEAVAPGTYYIRIKATDNEEASAANKVVVPGYELKAITLKTTGAPAGCSIALNGGDGFTAATNSTNAAAAAGVEVTITVTSASGYALSKLEVKKPSTAEVSTGFTSTKPKASYSFVMPNDTVDITAEWTKMYATFSPETTTDAFKVWGAVPDMDKMTVTLSQPDEDDVVTASGTLKPVIGWRGFSGSAQYQSGYFALIRINVPAYQDENPVVGLKMSDDSYKWITLDSDMCVDYAIQVANWGDKTANKSMEVYIDYGTAGVKNGEVPSTSARKYTIKFADDITLVQDDVELLKFDENSNLEVEKVSAEISADGKTTTYHVKVSGTDVPAITEQAPTMSGGTAFWTWYGISDFTDTTTKVARAAVVLNGDGVKVQQKNGALKRFKSDIINDASYYFQENGETKATGSADVVWKVKEYSDMENSNYWFLLQNGEKDVEIIVTSDGVTTKIVIDEINITFASDEST